MKAGGSANDAEFGVEDAANYGVLTIGDEVEGNREVIPTERGDYRRFYSGIAQAIAGGTAPPVTAADAVLGLRIIELARRSSAEGRRVTV